MTIQSNEIKSRHLLSDFSTTYPFTLYLIIMAKWTSKQNSFKAGNIFASYYLLVLASKPMIDKSNNIQHTKMHQIQNGAKRLWDFYQKWPQFSSSLQFSLAKRIFERHVEHYWFTCQRISEWGLGWKKFTG